MRRHLPAPDATEALARELLEQLPEDTAGWTLLLEGDLGAGKSTFARALIHAMGHRGPVPSPTYTLVEPYELGGRIIYHVDLYRVSEEEELRYLGWTELEEGLRLVEWPERAPGLTAAADLRVHFDYSNGGRDVAVDGLSARGQALVVAWAGRHNT